MHFKAIALVGFASAAAGQMMSLTDALKAQPMLSNLTTYLELFPSFETQLAGMSNITVLAPTNMAFTAALNSSTGAAFQTNDTGLIEALFSYHVLSGTYANFTTMPEFVMTALMPGMFANVTGGQAVEAISSGNMSNSTTSFYSGLLQNSSTVANGTANFTGGVIHMIDSFLTLPR